MKGSILPKAKIIEALEVLIVSGERIVLEGDNQKQADFLSRSLGKVDAKKLHDLHLIISSIGRPEHLTLFELGIAKKVDFAFAGPPSLRVSQLLEDLLVIACPMWNFGIPSSLKAWIDYVVRAGKTSNYAGAGVESLSPVQSKA